MPADAVNRDATGRLVRAGAAVVDVTPAPGAAMSGFVARTAVASGVHDPITVRAVSVDDTAIVAVDVVGLHEDLCARVARRCPLPEGNVRVHATHTHGGPASVPGRLGPAADPGWLARLENACVRAVDEALAGARPARILAGYAAEVDVARNRRRPDGPVDRSLPTVRLVGEDGGVIALLTSYACHPVVLGPDNTLLTADYPGVVRRIVEERLRPAVAIFLTGCAGDANNGHAASASADLRNVSGRTFADAERAGTAIAEAVLDAALMPCDGPVRSATATTSLDVVPDPERTAAGTWERSAADPAGDPGQVALMRCWAGWATDVADDAPTTWTARVGLLGWGDVRIVTLPGEPFAATGQDLRTRLDTRRGITIVAGYTDGCPGYLAPPDEQALGGYEVAEAHRYYGMPGPFAPDSAARLVDAVLGLPPEA